MNDPTPARPELPELFPPRISSFQVDSTMRTTELTTYDEQDMRTYGRMCDEAARADERRKALEAAIQAVHNAPPEPLEALAAIRALIDPKD